MNRALITLAAALTVTSGAQASLAPDPAPGATPGPIRYVAYDVILRSNVKGVRFRCHYPIHGHRHCVRIR